MIMQTLDMALKPKFDFVFDCWRICDFCGRPDFLLGKYGFRTEAQCARAIVAHFKKRGLPIIWKVI